MCGFNIVAILEEKIRLVLIQSQRDNRKDEFKFLYTNQYFHYSIDEFHPVQLLCGVHTYIH